jgi:hypothetical protein
MASNYKAPGDKKFFAVPATAASAGSPVTLGKGLTGVTLTDRTTAGSAVVDLGKGIWDLEVKASNDGGNTTLATWDQVFITMACSPVLNKRMTGKFFGFALGSIATSGATSTIPVLHEDGIGSDLRLLAGGQITTSNSTSNSVTVVGASSTAGDFVLANSATDGFTVSQAYVSAATANTVHITTSAAATGGTVSYMVYRAKV